MDFYRAKTAVRGSSDVRPPNNVTSIDIRDRGVILKNWPSSLKGGAEDLFKKTSILLEFLRLVPSKWPAQLVRGAAVMSFGSPAGTTTSSAPQHVLIRFLARCIFQFKSCV